jgi:hypothetical protein
MFARLWTRTSLWAVARIGMLIVVLVLSHRVAFGLGWRAGQDALEDRVINKPVESYFNHPR